MNIFCMCVRGWEDIKEDLSKSYALEGKVSPGDERQL